jgi:hypothetical protein
LGTAERGRTTGNGIEREREGQCAVREASYVEQKGVLFNSVRGVMPIPQHPGEERIHALHPREPSPFRDISQLIPRPLDTQG